MSKVLRDWCEEHNRGWLPNGLCPECEARARQRDQAREARNGCEPMAEPRYAVMGETEHGVLTIRTFATRQAAESHPVKLSLWQRVWVEKVKPPPARKARSLRLPWTIEQPAGVGFTYLRDADGSRVASLFGTRAEQRATISMLRQRGLFDG